MCIRTILGVWCIVLKFIMQKFEGLTLCHPVPVCSWVSVLQNSKEEALNKAFKGDQDEGENNIIQELTKAIVSEVKRISGNDSCCDCGAAG